MGHKVSRYSEEKKEQNPGSGRWPGEKALMEVFRRDTITVVADTYSELIAAIDEIPDADLTWSGRGNLGIEGMPNKRNGKWEATLITPYLKQDSFYV